MREHTTHFMDCGCVGAERDALAAQVAELRAVLTSTTACLSMCGGLLNLLSVPKADAVAVTNAVHDAAQKVSVGKTALASTPAASLAAYRARVVEEYKRLAMQVRLVADDAEMVDDDQGPFLAPAFFAKVEAAAIRALAATPQQSGKGERG